MSVRAGLALVFLARLAVATVAIAQVADDADGPPSLPVAPRVEVGVTAGATIGLPDLGLTGSVPLGRGPSLDLLLAHMTPGIWDSSPRFLAQAQFRVPFRGDLRSRKSFLIGATRIGARRGRDVFGFDTFLRPHAGTSLQWPMSRGSDLRLDLQGIFTLDRHLPMIPRAAVAIVWHTKPAPRPARRPS